MQVCNDSLAAAVIEAVVSGESPARKPKEILVPIDFSESSLTALRCARALAEAGKDHVILLNVVEEPDSFRTLNVVSRQRARYSQRAERLHELANRELGARVVARIEVRAGRPLAEIVRSASKRRADLIIVGRHPHHGLRHWLRGHTATQLSKRAPCPVLLLQPGYRPN